MLLISFGINRSMLFGFCAKLICDQCVQDLSQVVQKYF